MSLFSRKSKVKSTKTPTPSTSTFCAHMEPLEDRFVPVSNVIPGTDLAGPTYESSITIGGETIPVPADPVGAVSSQYLVAIVNNNIHWQLRPELDDPNSPFDQTPVEVSLTTFFTDTTFQRSAIGLAVPPSPAGGVTGWRVTTEGAGGYVAPSSPAVDGRVIYDHIFNRFVVAASSDNNSNTSSILVAVSVTENPNDGWFFLSIGTNFQGTLALPGRDADGNLIAAQTMFTGDPYNIDTGSGGGGVVDLFGLGRIPGVSLGLTRNNIVITTPVNTVINGFVFTLDSQIYTVSKPFLYEGTAATVDFLTPSRLDYYLFPPANAAPFITPVTEDNPFVISRDAANGTILQRVPAWDREGQLITYELLEAGNTDGAFAINSSNGNLILANRAALVDNDEFTLTVRVRDASGNERDGTIFIQVLEGTAPVVNDATFIVLNTVGFGTIVGQVPAYDPRGVPLTYTFQSLPGNPFNVNPTTGQITVANPAVLSSAGAQAATFTFTVTASNGSQTATGTMTINVITNQPPVVAAGITYNLPPGAVAGTIVGVVPAYDPDGHTLSFAITGGNVPDPPPVVAPAFTVDNQGVIRVNNPGLIAVTGDFTITVTVTDSLGAAGTGDIAIVQSAAPNPTPIIIPGSVYSIQANTNLAVGTVVGRVPVFAAAGAPVTYAIVAGDVFNAFNIDATGVITVTNLANLGQFSSPIVLTIQLNGDPTTNQTVVINFVNQAPVIGPAAFTVPRDVVDGAVVGTVPAYDPEGRPLTGFAITGGNTGGAFAIDANTGQITVVSGNAVRAAGGFNLQISASDGIVTGTGSVTITIPANRPPIIGNAVFNVPRTVVNGVRIGQVPAYDPEGLPLTYAFAGGFLVDPTGTFIIDANTGVITLINNENLILAGNLQRGFVLNIQVSDGESTTTGSVLVTTESYHIGMTAVQNFGNDSDSAFMLDWFYFAGNDLGRDPRAVLSWANIFRLDVNFFTAPIFTPQYAPLDPTSLPIPPVFDPALGEAPWLPEFGTIPVALLTYGTGYIPTSAVWLPDPNDPNGGVGSLWTANTITGPNGIAEVHWYEFRVRTVANQVIFLGADGAAPIQQGGVDTTGVEEGGVPLATYAPAIMVDRFNNMAIAFAGSSGAQRISAYFAGRFHDDRFNPKWDGTTRPAKILRLGDDLYARGVDVVPWGITSGLALDPTDRTSFWTFNAYAQVRPVGNVFGSWATTWGQFISIPDRQIFVIDVSSSMNDVKAQDVNGNGFSDSSDDLNGDGLDGTLIDLAIAEVLRLYETNLLPGMQGDPGEVAIVIFAGEAKPLVLKFGTSLADSYFIDPTRDLNENGESDFVEALKSIRQGRSQFIVDTRVGSFPTLYAPAIEVISDLAAFFALDVTFANMYSDGSGRLPTVTPASLLGAPRIDTVALGPYSFNGPTIDYQRINTISRGTFAQVNSPGSNTVDGGYFPVVRVPPPVFTGSASDGVSITLADGTVITIFPDGSFTVFEPNPADPGAEPETTAPGATASSSSGSTTSNSGFNSNASASTSADASMAAEAERLARMISSGGTSSDSVDDLFSSGPII